MADRGPASKGVIRRLLDGLYLGAGYLAGLFLIAIFLLMLGLAIGREVGVNIPSGDDFAAWSMAAMAFLGLAHTLKAGEMIRVGLLVDRCDGKTRRAFELFALVLGLLFVGFFAWHAVALAYGSWRFDDTSQGVIAVPLWIPQLGYASGLVILTIAFADELVHVLAGHLPRYERAKAATAEEAIERAARSGV